MRLPSKTLINRLLSLDADFYGKEFPKSDVSLSNPSPENQPIGRRLVDWLYVFQGIDDRHIVGAARRIIVPREATDRAKEILSKYSKSPPMVAIEDIS